MQEYGERHDVIYRELESYLKNYYRGIFDYLNVWGVRGKTALDVGCGHGYVLELLEKRGYKTYGIDLSEYGTRRAQKIVPRATLKVHDAERPFPFEVKFDLVTCFGLLGILRRPDLAIENCYNSLKPGGTFIATVPNSLGFIPLLFGKRVARAVRERQSTNAYRLRPGRPSGAKPPADWRKMLMRFKWRELEVVPIQRVPLVDRFTGRAIFLRFPLGDPLLIEGVK